MWSSFSFIVKTLCIQFSPSLVSKRKVKVMQCLSLYARTPTSMAVSPLKDLLELHQIIVHNPTQLPWSFNGNHHHDILEVYTCQGIAGHLLCEIASKKLTHLFALTGTPFCNSLTILLLSPRKAARKRAFVPRT